MTAPRFQVYASAEAAEKAAAARIAAALRDNPKAVLGLATGRTMEGVYRALLAAGANLSRASTFNLDEYCDLSPNHPGSFRSFMEEHLFEPATRPPADMQFPSTDAGGGDLYEGAIAAAGGIDLQLLGLGRNGHIGFNEPGSPPSSRTRTVDLNAETRAANASQFRDGDVPRQAVTVGIATILEARSILLLATGEAKADALAAALRGPVSAECPASFLAWHSDVTVIADRAAASLLSQSPILTREDVT